MKRPEKIYNRMPTAEEFNNLVDYIQSLEPTFGNMAHRKSSSGIVITRGFASVPYVSHLALGRTGSLYGKGFRKIKAEMFAEASGEPITEVIDELEEC